MVTTLLILFAMWQGSMQETGLVNISYNETDAIFPNPERGFYQWVAGTPTSPRLNLATLQAYRYENRTLIFRPYLIRDFIETDISEEFLDKMRDDFQTLRDAGMKTLFKFRYSTAIGEPDATLEQVLRHLDQLAPVFEEYYDVIAVAQAGFIGAWGEWHGSTNNLTTTQNKRNILFHFLDSFNTDRHIQIRYPQDLLLIYDVNTPLTAELAFDGSHRSRTGHHNDCFLASPTDVGTYRISAPWEKNYLHENNRYVPMGGETCNPRPDAGDRYHCETALKELAQMRWSFLNHNYSRLILDTWIDQGCMPEVERRLGYRFAMQQGSYSEQARAGGTLRFNLDLKNEGFAAPFNPRGVQVILRNFADPDEIWEMTLPDDPRLWMAGDTVNLSYDLGVPENLNGIYEVLLNLPDPTDPLRHKPEFSIRLANEHTWEEATGFNRLDHFILIDSTVEGESYDGDLMFVPFGTWDGSRQATSAGQDQDLDLDIPPSAFNLYPNYPNPFNPTTTITFDLYQHGHVTLEVFTMLGERVTTLIDGHRSAGSHQIILDMEDLSSGIYIYTLTSGQARQSHTMTLIK